MMLVRLLCHRSIDQGPLAGTITLSQPAIKLRQGIWDQLYALDGEYRGKFDRYITVEPAPRSVPLA